MCALVTGVQTCALPISPRPRNTSTSSGTTSCRSCCSSTNSHDIGCSRCTCPSSGPAPALAGGAGSVGVVIVVIGLAREVVAQALGIAGVEPGQRHLAVARAGGVDHQREIGRAHV